MELRAIHLCAGGSADPLAVLHRASAAIARAERRLESGRRGITGGASREKMRVCVLRCRGVLLVALCSCSALLGSGLG